MAVINNRMAEEPPKKADPTLPARPVLNPGTKAAPIKPPPDAGLQPVGRPAAETQGTVKIPASALTPTYAQGQTPAGAYDPQDFVAPAQEAAPSEPVNHVENSQSVPPPAQAGEKAYTWKELEDFQAAMSAADKAAMQEQQRTMLRRGKYTNTPSATSIRLAQPYNGNWYYDYGEPVWLDYWSTSPNAGAGTGSGTGAGIGAGTGAGTGAGAGAGTEAGGNAGTGFASPDNLSSLLEEWKKAAAEQANGQIDYAVQQAVTELERALEDSKVKFKEQAESVARDELQGLDNSALYAEMRGDKGGIGQSQYNEIQAAAAQNRLAVQQAQTKLATDTSRQIADLRAQGEFRKADTLLEITQTYLSQLISLEQWQAEFGLSREKFEASLLQWQKEYELAVEKLGVSRDQWEREFAYGKQTDEQKAGRELAYALLKMGVELSPEQAKLLGLTEEQMTEWLWREQFTDSGKGTYEPLQTKHYEMIDPYLGRMSEKEIFRAIDGMNLSVEDKLKLIGYYGLEPEDLLR